MSINRCGSKTRIVSVTVLIITVLAIVATGSVAATEGATANEIVVDENGEVVSPNENERHTTISATSSSYGSGEITQQDSSVTVAAIVSPPSDSSFGSLGSFGSDDTVDIWMSAYDSGDIPDLIENEPLNVTIEQPNGNQESFSVTTDGNGSAHLAYDLSDREDGEYRVQVASGNNTEQAELMFNAGPVVDIMNNRRSGIFVNDETTFSFLVRNGEYGASNQEVRISIGDEYENTHETNEDGFVEIPFTPDESGQYSVEAELTNGLDSDSRSFTATEYTLASDYSLREAISGEQTVYGGYLRTANGQATNTDINISLTHREETIVEEQVTTDQNGFFLLPYETPANITDGDRLNVESETVDGTPIHVRFDRLWVNEFPDSDSPDQEAVTLDTSVDTDITAAGGDVSIDLTADENGEPITNEDVDIVVNWDGSEVPMFSTTVATNNEGLASTTISIPENALDGVRPSGEAVLEYNNTVTTDSLSFNLEEYNLRINQIGAAPGEEGTIGLTAEDQLTGEPVEGVPMQFAALYAGYKIDTFDTGQLITSSDGSDDKTILVPADIGPGQPSINDVNRYWSTGSNWIGVADHPGTLSVSNETVRPGETITLEFSTDTEETASGIAFARPNRIGSFGTEITSDSESTFTVPEYVEAGDSFSLRVWAADETGQFYEDTIWRLNVEETDDDDDEDPTTDVLVVDGIGDDPGTFETIQAAADEAESGTTIEVAPGEYNEFVDILTQGVTLESQEGPENTIISEPVSISADDVVVDGFTLDFSDEESDREFGFSIFAENATITRNVVTGDVGNDIFVFAENTVQIENNTLEGTADFGPDGGLINIRNNTDNTDTDYVIQEVNGIQSNEEIDFAIELIESNSLDVVQIGDEIFPADPEPPAVQLDAPATVSPDTAFTLSAEGSDVDAIEQFTWLIEDESGTTVDEATTDGDMPVYTTSLSEVGQYSATVTAVGQRGAENSTTVEIDVIEQPNLVTSIDADDQQRLQDNPSVDVTIENEGAQVIDDSVNVVVSANGTPFETGQPVDATTNFEINETLNPGDSISETISLFELTDERLVGDVLFEAEADPDNDINETTTETNTAETTVDVTYVNLQARAQTRDSVAEGKNITLRSFITNVGTAESDTRNATVSIENGDTEQYNITLGALEPGEQSVDRTRQAFNESGNYTMQVDIDGTDQFPENTTDTSAFSVEEYDLTFTGEDNIRVPSEISAGSSFSVAFEFQTNAAENVSADLSLPEEIEVRDDQHTQTIPADAGNNTVRWDLIANESTEDEVELQVSVEDTLDLESSVNDTISANTSIPIVTERVGNTTSVVIEEGDTTETAVLELENADRDTSVHNLSISAQGDAEGRTLDGLEYLVRYPYGCVEQTTSSFVGALNTQEYYDDRPDADIDPDQEPVINESIEAGVERLSEGGKRGQLPEGGWNLWGNENRGEETFPTTYAVFGLSSVDNNENYAVSELSQGNIDFEAAVDSMDGLQEDDGKFESQSYFRDPNSMTGFTMVTLEETAQVEDLESDTKADIAEIQANASEYLVGKQTENGAWQDEGFRAEDSATSTALAIWGLQSALDNDNVEFDSVDTNETEIEAAIESGHQWLIDEQVQDPNDENFGAWDKYHDSGFWNQQGDTSEEAAFATYALDATNETADIGDDTTFAIANSTEFLTSVYQERGSWGYTRASTFAVGALQEVGEGLDGDITVTVTLGDGAIEEVLEIGTDNPREAQRLTLDTNGDELEQLREASEDGTVSVEVETDSDALVIVAVENDQVIEVEGGE